MNTHINLIVEGSKNRTQPVEVEPISTNVYRVLYSPGFVEGIAAGDTISVLDDSKGTFKVVEYGGNVAVKISDSISIVNSLQEINAVLAEVNARFDGNLEKVGVWTIPVSQGFKAIETAISIACELLQEPIWWYGNVYDEQDKPLDWWL